MKTKRNAHKRIMMTVLTVLAYCLLPFTCMSALFIVNWFGFELAFVTEFTVENRSGETIHITPVGAVGREGKRTRLTLYMCRFPAIMAFRNRDLRLDDGGRIRILYKSEDVTFSEILVRAETNRYFKVVTNPEPTKNQHRPPLADPYVVGKLSELQVADQKVLRALDRKPLPFQVFWVMLPFGVLGLFLLICRRVMRRRHLLKNKTCNEQ